MKSLTYLGVHPNQWVWRLLAASLITILFFPSIQSFAQENSTLDDEDLEKFLQLEPGELKLIPVIDITITTASKRPEKLWETAAAAYVISATEIQRSAATTIPDLLRMVPGLFVGQADSSTWIVGSRGWAGEYGVELLVLIDGRQVNNLYQANTFWNIQDYPLEDIERIEIIRGPGGTLWGTNSGNGVINIITKQAKDTQGGLLSIVGGTDLDKSVFRYGGKMGEDAFYRIYGTYKDIDSFKDVDKTNSVDDWALAKAGYRIDWEPSERDKLTFIGDVYKDDAWFTWFVPGNLPHEFYPVKDRYEKDKEGVDLQFQWDRLLENGSNLKWDIYFDYFSFNNDFAVNFDYQTFKTDFQYQFDAFSNHSFNLGTGYRLISDEYYPSYAKDWPPSANTQIFTAFIQDNVSIIEDILKLSIGTQIQYSDLNDFDYQPSLKLVYTPNERYTIWSAVTRAAQLYYRGIINTSYIYYADEWDYGSGKFPRLVMLNTENINDSESILSFEIGQRFQATKYLSFELNTFYTNIDNHLSENWDFNNYVFFMDPIPHNQTILYGGNLINGETYGAELSVNSQITEFWKLTASYTALDIQLHLDPNITGFYFNMLEDASPHHQLKFQSYLDISKDIQLDAFYYFVDEIGFWRTPPHGRLDVRLGWKPNKQLELSIAGTNLLDDQTHEAYGMHTAYTEVERGVYGKLTYRF